MMIAWMVFALLVSSSGVSATDQILTESTSEARALPPEVSNPTNRPNPASTTDRPRHEPIEILGDADLVSATTPLADKGVRGGQGTAEDPYVIRNWHISSNEEDGIYIFNTSQHLVIREVTITQDVDRDQSVGIFVDEAGNVIIEDVMVRGRQTGGVAVFDSPGGGLMTVDPVAIRNVTVLRDRELPATTDAFWIEDSDGILIEQVNISGAFYSGVFVNDASATIRSSRFDLVRRFTPPSDYFTRYYRGTGVLYTASEVDVLNNTFVRMPYFVYPVATHDTSPRRATVQGNRFVPSSDDVGAVVLSGADVDIEDNQGSVVYGVTGGNVTVKDNELKHLVFSGNRRARLDVTDNMFDGLGRCHSSIIDGYSDTGYPDDIENVPNVPQSWGSDGSCNAGLDVKATRGTSVRITSNVFKRYPKTAVWLKGPHLEATENTLYDNAFQDGDTNRGCNPVPIIFAKPVGSSAEAELTENDILRSPRSGCGVGLETDGPRYTIQQPDSPTGRRVMNGSRTDREIDATGNYWGPVAPKLWSEGGPEDPRALAIAPPSKNQTIDVDPWSTTPNVLSPSFVESYFENYPAGNPLPSPPVAAVLAALAGAALLGRRIAG